MLAKASEKQDDVHVDITVKVDHIAGRVDAMHETQQKFLPLLKDITESRKSSRTLHRGIIEKSVVGMVWGAIVFVGLSAWHYIKVLLEEGPS